MGYGEYTDMKLVQLLKAADRRAYNEIYKRYWKKLLLIAWNHSKDDTTAIDIVQEVFIDLWERANSCETLNLSAFLATAVKYKIYAHYSKEQRCRQPAKSNDACDEFSDDEALLDARFLKSLMNGVVEEMPEKCRIVFNYSRETDFKNDEIAQQTNGPGKNVENTFNRALRIIRCALKKHGNVGLIE